MKGDQSVVGSVRIGCGGDANGGLVCRMDGEGVGDGRDGDRDVLSLWEDNVANVTLGTDPNSPFAYAPGLEHHHPNTSSLGDPGGRLNREREIDRDRERQIEREELSDLNFYL